MRIIPSILLTILTFHLAIAQHPGPRDHFGLAYDSHRDRLVLFGGNDLDADGKYKWNPTTWEWDGQMWALVDEAGIGEVSSITTVYDPERKELISFGGYKPGTGSLDETWTFSGAQWDKQEIDGPSARSSCPITYDKKRQEVILFSGCTSRPYLSDTYRLTKSGWEKIPVEGPPGVCRGALFFDEVRETVVLFGGAITEGNEWIRSDVFWEWDGTSWSEIIVETKPSGRSNILMAYDSNRKRAVLFGGNTTDQVSSELWEWDGKEWLQIPTNGDWPSAVETFGITYHKRQKKVFLYGGRTGPASPVADFWSWDGTRWEKVE